MNKEPGGFAGEISEKQAGLLSAKLQGNCCTIINIVKTSQRFSEKAAELSKLKDKSIFLNHKWRQVYFEDLLGSSYLMSM